MTAFNSIFMNEMFGISFMCENIFKTFYQFLSHSLCRKPSAMKEKKQTGTLPCG